MTSSLSPLPRAAPPLVAIGLVLAAASSPAHAQTAADKAEAESLFDEAGKLLRGGDARAACPKLERSLQLDRGIGTLLFLAECYERVGRVASAWATFREAAAEARAVGQAERERIASARAKKLDASVPRLRIDVPEGTLPKDAVVSRDERALDPATFGTAIAVDPGTHVITVVAPGHEPHRVERALTLGEETTVQIAPLVRTRAPVPVATGKSAGVPPPERARGVRTATLVVGGVGLSLGVVGAAFGVRAFGKWADAESRCDAQVRCTRAGLDRIDEANTAATASTLLVSASVVALSVSGYMLWRDFRPQIALTDRGVSLRGSF